jgi:hypothetical protein
MVVLGEGIEIPGIQFQIRTEKYTEESNTALNKALNQTKEKKSNSKTGNKQNKHRLLSVLTKRLNCARPILARVNIFAITDLIIAILFCLC